MNKIRGGEQTAPDDLRAIAEQAWRATPAGMAARLSEGRWNPQPLHLHISMALAQAALEGGRRTIVCVPPRYGKSELCSHWFPTWYLDRFPSRQIMLTSYSGDYAGTWGRKVRNTIERNEKHLRVRLSKDSTAAGEWNTTEDGGMVSCGVEGSQTGRGAHVLLIDDPIRNWTEAYSADRRETIWDWFKSTAYTRLEPKASVFLIMTRWHDDDLAGRLIRLGEKGEGDRWDVIKFPALAEEDDSLGRAPGEPLWPSRFTLEDLERIAKAVGGKNGLVWSGLFQQRPVPEGSKMFASHLWKRYFFPPRRTDFSRIITSWDMSFKDLKSSSFVVGQVWGFRGARAYLLDQVRDRWDFLEATRRFLALSEDRPEANTHLVEDKANGPAIISALRQIVPGLLEVTPRGSKEARAAAIQPFVAAGNVFLPSELMCPWIRAYEEEFQSFPVGKADDQVDATSQALAWQWLMGAIQVGKMADPLELLIGPNPRRR